MSKKNIARTAIEGGRTKYCRYMEDCADIAERQSYRRYCRQATIDPEAAEPRDNVFASPWETGKRARDFKDRLNPVLRWLESQVGRPWNKIMSDVSYLFDNRTTAGRHILGHVKTFVTLPTDKFQYNGYGGTRKHKYSGELFVNDAGILCRAPFYPRKNRYSRG